ncbi:T4-like baseplate tail tube cap protein [Synechococcus phage metaG-MbCM1]|uniref:T4-like baseplate tail tube cap protein n=1 Tax=Synechococcus phage metaG-MbCM1 TaxID=1079999 RepID=H8ZMY8_9CAUD|nr:T4-like baseplate tail tube cap protein [Synechococcus phage metaG-MbCM1]AFD02849.1 T4-like baseplate tail tube cap protein [Synechococcus phage metaG-MbCM1]
MAPATPILTLAYDAWYAVEKFLGIARYTEVSFLSKFDSLPGIFMPL